MLVPTCRFDDAGIRLLPRLPAVGVDAPGTQGRHLPGDLLCQSVDHQLLVVIGWLRKFACATDDDAPRFHGQINERAVDSGQFDADTDAVFAPVRVDRRLPGVPCKPRKLRTRQFVRDIVQCAMQPAQLDVPNWVHRKTKLLPRALHFQSPQWGTYTTGSSTSEPGCNPGRYAAVRVATRLAPRHSEAATPTQALL